jgi:hypothetical protein
LTTFLSYQFFCLLLIDKARAKDKTYSYLLFFCLLLWLLLCECSYLASLFAADYLPAKFFFFLGQQECGRLLHEMAKELGKCTRLLKRLLDISQRPIVKHRRGSVSLLALALLAVLLPYAYAHVRGAEVFSSAFATKATLGVILSDRKIDSMVIGGPAFLSGKLAKGDEVMQVDGIECPTFEMLHAYLTGSDTPGSIVSLTVKKALTV